MKKLKELNRINPLDELCISIKKLVLENDFENCEKLIFKAMEDFPHAPEPHNLLGIVLEKSGNHSLAMKHFLAAWALDPTYRPANYNLETFGTFFSHGNCAYDDNDIPMNKKSVFSATCQTQSNI